MTCACARNFFFATAGQPVALLKVRLAQDADPDDCDQPVTIVGSLVDATACHDLPERDPSPTRQPRVRVQICHARIVGLVVVSGLAIAGHVSPARGETQATSPRSGHVSFARGETQATSPMSDPTAASSAVGSGSDASVHVDRNDDAHGFVELGGLTGTAMTAGSFLRNCGYLTTTRFICIDFTAGRDRGGSGVTDLFLVGGLRRSWGRFDMSGEVAASALPLTVGIVASLFHFVFPILPDDGSLLPIFRIFPFTGAAGIHATADLGCLGKSHLRLELGVRAYLPIATNVIVRFPTPFGLAASAAIGLRF